jgi:hypothetical protein
MAIFDKISGISTGSGFKYQSEAPLDARLVVDYYSELNELVEAKGAYVGMLVYVKTDTEGHPKGHYNYEGNNIWTEFNAAKVQVSLDDGSKPHATITISKDEPTDGNAGDIWFKY